MSNHPISKDPIQAAYLQHLRDRNVKIASTCHYCEKASSGINSDGYRILFVCNDHFEAGDDVILDTSIPGVIHYTYPNGKDVPEHMMNPNVGGFLGKCTHKYEYNNDINLIECIKCKEIYPKNYND